MKTMLITGASSGVGKSLVDKYNLVYELVTISRRPIDKVSGRHKHYICDLADLDSLEKTLDVIIQEADRVDYVLNCAGVMLPGQISEISAADLEMSIRVNAVAPVILIKKLLPYMKYNDYGRILNFTSGAPLNCFGGYGMYSASKAALNALSITLNNELDGYNVFSALLSPGPVRSEMSPNAELEPAVCHEVVDYLLKSDKENIEVRMMYWFDYLVPLLPQLEGVDWLNGNAKGRLQRYDR